MIWKTITTYLTTDANNTKLQKRPNLMDNGSKSQVSASNAINGSNINNNVNKNTNNSTSNSSNKKKKTRFAYFVYSDWYNTVDCVQY